MSTFQKEKYYIFNIDSLPEDIQKKIYIDHFHIKHKCDILLKWWNDNSQLNCSASEVEGLTNEILSNKEGVEYLKKHNKYFSSVYEKHFTYNRQPTFELMTRTQSLIASVLMHMWH